MQVQPKAVLVYQTREGRLLFNEWLHGLDDQNAVARVLARIGRVRRGNLGDCKPVGEGVSELRLDYGPGYRIYFAQKGQTLVILLCGGDKRRRAGILPWLGNAGRITNNARRSEI